MESQKFCLLPSHPVEVPWLVYQHNEDHNKQLFSTIWPENKSYSKAIPELHAKVVYASPYGWLLLDHGSSRFSLWNPVTSETIPLPQLEHFFDLDDEDNFEDGLEGTCVLTSSPDKDDNFVIFMFSRHLSFSCCPNDEEPRWRVDDVVFKGIRASVDNVFACNGLIYAWGFFHNDDRTFEDSLVTIKYNGSSSPISLTWLQIQMPNCITPNRNGNMNYLLESCGQIYLVSGIYRHRKKLSSIDICELDLEEKQWVKVKYWNNRTCFLNRNSCTWCWGSAQVEGNMVFLEPNHDDHVNNILYCYNLQDRSFTVYSPDPKLCSSWRQPFWYIPKESQSRNNVILSAREVSQEPSIDELVNQNADIIEDIKPTGNMSLNHLPFDIITLISEYVHRYDYQNFRNTCKTLQSLTSHSQCQSRRNYGRLFISLIDINELFQVIEPICNEVRSITIPTKLKDGIFSIVFAKEGWLILYEGGTSFYFLNLFTRLMFDFPPHTLKTLKHYLMNVGFSTTPSSSDCVTVAMLKFNLFYYDPHPIIEIWYFQYGDRRWKYIKIDQYGDFLPSNCPPLYRNGCFYFLGTTGCVGEFELDGKKSTWKVYAKPETENTLFHSSHLVECGNQMFVVFIGKFGEWVQVFRFDDLKKCWVNVNNLGHRVFFISFSSCVSTVAKDAGMGNRIYLSKFRDNRFIFYSLETRKYHVDGTHGSMDSFYPYNEPAECCWV